MSARDYLQKGRDLAERIPYSVIALASRFAVADVFWRSGQTKIKGFSIREETFYLFREEYKVPLLPPDVAAYLSTISEHVFPILLFLGLASRLSALALFGELQRHVHAMSRISGGASGNSGATIHRPVATVTSWHVPPVRNAWYCAVRSTAHGSSLVPPPVPPLAHPLIKACRPHRIPNAVRKKACSRTISS